MILFHHRLLHSPSINCSRDRVRHALFCDFQRADYQRACKEAPGRLWEEWPALHALAEGEAYKSAAPISLPPRRLAAMPAWLKTTSGTCQTTSKAKALASSIARMRQVGDYWVVLASNNLNFKTNKLELLGDDLAGAGVHLLHNGKEVESLAGWGFINRLEAGPGENTLEISGAPSNLYLRVVRVDVPLAHSEVVLREVVKPSQGKLNRFGFQAGQQSGRAGAPTIPSAPAAT